MVKRIARCFIVFIVLMGTLLAIGSSGQESYENHSQNSSTDGRVHTCGLVTEDGVTEYLSEYKARCGN